MLRTERPTEPAVRPGKKLLEALRERQMTQVELCTRVGVSRKLICEIIKGKAHVSPETGFRLDLALGSPRGFWSRLQSRHFEELARRRHTEALSRQLGWLREVPVRAMIDARWIEERGCDLEQAQTLLEWFGVTTPEAWRSVYVAPQAGFHCSPAFTGGAGCVVAGGGEAGLLDRHAALRPQEVHAGAG